MDTFSSLLPYFAAAILSFLTPLVIGAPAVLRHFGSQTARGTFRPYAPTWIALYGLSGTVAGIVLWFHDLPIAGIVFVCAGNSFGLLASSMADAMHRSFDEETAWLPQKTGVRRWWKEMNFGGTTALGNMLIPNCLGIQWTILVLVTLLH